MWHVNIFYTTFSAHIYVENLTQIFTFIWHMILRKFIFSRLNIYRATLCVSVVFAVARCPSVCLSVTLVHCIQTAEDIIKLLCRLGSPIILVFDSQRRYPIPREPLQRGCKIQRGGKILRFSIEIAV